MNRHGFDPRLRSALGAALLLAGTFPAHPAAAERFYTFDVSIDALVEIDTATGTATNLGFVGGPVTAASGFRVAMEYVDGTVFWTGIESPLLLHRATVNPIAFLGSTPWTGGSPPPRGNGGMTWDGSTLVVSYIAGCCGIPAHVGELSPAGALSNTTDYSAFGVRLHLLASAPDGTLLALEDFPSATPPTGRLMRLQRPVAAVTVLGDIPHAAANTPFVSRYTGLDFTDSGALWLLQRTDFIAWTMRRIDPGTGAVLEDAAITYSTPYSTVAFVGLAHLGSPPVPAATTSWGRIKGAYRGSGR